MRIKQTFIALMTLISVQSVHATGIPVIDIVADVQRAAQLLTQALQYAKQIEEYKKLVEQVDKQVETIEQLVSEAEVQDFIASEEWNMKRREIPSVQADIMEALLSGDGDYFKELISKKMEDYGLIDPGLLFDSQKRGMVENNYQTAGLKADATATLLMEQSEDRQARIEELILKLGESVSVAQKADLQAALMAENSMNLNTLIQLQAANTKAVAAEMSRESYGDQSKAVRNIVESDYYHLDSNTPAPTYEITE